MLRLLFIGDVYGRPGRRVLCDHLPTIRSRFDFVIANGENAAGGFGLNRESAKLLWDAGVDCITLGNHAFGNREVHGLLDDPRVVRPMNYPLGTPGHGWWTYTVDGEPLTVVNALGRTFMDPVDDPFVAMQDLLERDGLGSVVLDFHAEATSEKAAMAFFLDGRVSAVLGTHTHVATADTRILPKGTAFQTDAGMTGPLDSVIGAAPDGPIQRYLTRMPVRFEVGQGRAQLNAVELDLDGGRATRVARYSFTEEDGGRK